MTEDEMRELIQDEAAIVYFWACPLCDLISDRTDTQESAFSDLRYHINEDHKGEEE